MKTLVRIIIVANILFLSVLTSSVFAGEGDIPDPHVFTSKQGVQMPNELRTKFVIH